MTRLVKLAIAVTVLAAALPRGVGHVSANATTSEVSRVTLVASNGTAVATGAVVCTARFNYLIVGVSLSASALPTGATVYDHATPDGPLQVVAASTGTSLPYVFGYPSTCPPVGSTLLLVNNRTGATLGHGTISAYAPF